MDQISSRRGLSTAREERFAALFADEMSGIPEARPGRASTRMRI
jgi:hypothetical protein